MMTGRSVEVEGVRYYHPDDLSVYCESADCNYDRKLAELPTPSHDEPPKFLPGRSGMTCAEFNAAFELWHRNAHEGPPHLDSGPQAFVPGLGTVRECLDCGCLVAGGPVRCKMCAGSVD